MAPRVAGGNCKAPQRVLHAAFGGILKVAGTEIHHVKSAQRLAGDSIYVST